MSDTAGLSPACAGEPSSQPNRCHWYWVYPRVCGGTVNSYLKDLASYGLSPRVRGNPTPSYHGALAQRSIPACAGEPWDTATTNQAFRVYPRVCGGTSSSSVTSSASHGLSPRVRGNPSWSSSQLLQHRSIPACAGEPLAITWLVCLDTVYPRVCGGTLVSPVTSVCAEGLSPRVRGNRTMETKNLASNGSIPACAGEPPRARPGGRNYPVYPRVCGGTTASSMSQ